MSRREDEVVVDEAAAALVLPLAAPVVAEGGHPRHLGDVGGEALVQGISRDRHAAFFGDRGEHYYMVK